MVAVAVLEATSVIIVVMRVARKTSSAGGMKSKLPTCWPRKEDKQDVLEASAIANPPPTRRISPQGNFSWMIIQRRAGLRFDSISGMKEILYANKLHLTKPLHTSLAATVIDYRL